MTVITGDKFKTSWGEFIVVDRWSNPAMRGDTVLYENKTYIIKAVVPPKKPDGKWSVEVTPTGIDGA